MQTKFITLAVSAVLALSAMSANALPAAAGTNDNAVANTDSKAVEHSAAANKDVAAAHPKNKDVEIDGLLDGVLELVDGVVVPVVADLLDIVVDLLKAVLGTGNPRNGNGLLDNVLNAVLRLLDLKPGASGHQPRGQPEAPPHGSDSVTIVIVFVKNIANGHGGHAAANNDVQGLLGAVLDLVTTLLFGSHPAAAPRQ